MVRLGGALFICVMRRGGCREGEGEKSGKYLTFAGGNNRIESFWKKGKVWEK